MSKNPLGFVELNASSVLEASRTIIDGAQELREKKLDEIANEFLTNRQPGWIARNIFRVKPMLTREDALERAYNDAGLAMNWHMWDIYAKSSMESSMIELNAAAETAVNNNVRDILVSSKAASWLKDFL